MERNFGTDGFLCDEWQAIAGKVRQHYPQDFALFTKVNRAAWRQQYQLNASPQSPRQAFASGYFARVLMLTQATAMSLERGMIAAGNVLLRSAIETLFTLGAIAKRANRVERILTDSELRKKSMLDSMERANVWPIFNDESTDEERQRIGELKSTIGTVLSAADLARDAGLESWYQTIYGRLSWSVHAASHDVESHFVIEDGTLKELMNEPTIEGQKLLWMVCTNVVILALDYLSEVLEISQEGTKALNQEFEALYGDSK